MIVITREFFITGIRLLAARDGTVIAASLWGKLKTASQMTAIIFALTVVFFGEVELFTRIPFYQVIINVTGIMITVFLWVSAALTVISGVDYIVKNAKYINHRK